MKHYHSHRTWPLQPRAHSSCGYLSKTEAFHNPSWIAKEHLKPHPFLRSQLLSVTAGGGAHWVMSYEKEGVRRERKKDVRE